MRTCTPRRLSQRAEHEAGWTGADDEDLRVGHHWKIPSHVHGIATAAARLCAWSGSPSGCTSRRNRWPASRSPKASPTEPPDGLACLPSASTMWTTPRRWNPESSTRSCRTIRPFPTASSASSTNPAKTTSIPRTTSVWFLCLHRSSALSVAHEGTSLRGGEPRDRQPFCPRKSLGQLLLAVSARTKRLTRSTTPERPRPQLLHLRPVGRGAQPLEDRRSSRETHLRLCYIP